MVKNKVYVWVGRYYLISHGNGEVYQIVKGKLKHLPEMSTSTIRYYGDLVGINFGHK